MKAIVIGGGKVGYNLLKTLRDRGCQVSLIERDKNTCMRIADDIKADVIWGDGTDLEVLKDAGIDEAEIVAAVTGTDEENLVICQIAKLCFHTKRTIARINNPKNNIMFKKLGIDNTVCSTEVIASLIEYTLNNDDYRIISTFEKGAMILAEIVIKEHSTWHNKIIRELVLPKECVIVSIIRGEKVIYPRGDTKIFDGDRVLIISNHGELSKLVAGLYAGGHENEINRK